MTRAPDGTARLWTWVAIGTVLSLGVAVDTIRRQFIFGSPEGGWFYGYVDSPDTRWLLFFVISSALTGAAVAASWPWLVRLEDDFTSERRAWVLILAWSVLAVGVQGMLRSLTPHSFDALFTSDMSNSFYSVALRFDTGEILSDFHRRRPSWPLHAKSNLPGKVLLVRGLMQLSESPQVLAWLVVALSSLGSLFLYVFVRDLFDDRRLAVVSAILYHFTPAKFYFLPLLNTVTPVVVLACGVLLLRWLATGRRAYAALLGAAVYGLILFEPTALISGVLFVTILIRAVATGRISGRSTVLDIGVGIVAFLAMYATMRWFGFDMIRGFRDVAADAVAFNVEARRPYDIWVRQNLYDFAFGVGLCQIVLFAGALANGLVQLKAGGRTAGGATTIVLVTSAIVAMVGLADGFGVNRGEVIRLWIFLACLSQIPAAYMCRRLGHPMALVTVLTAALLQDAIGTAMIAFVVP